jgi:class 3 adenylate cyclase/tetratricopeptide (TPR) repeat protein
MKCPKCQHENPDEARFCNACGSKLEITCAECGKSNPPGSRFCNACGQTLTVSSEPSPKELSFDDKLDKIQRYLPKGLTEKILSQRDKIEGERKQVTVMFCDMAGFTPLVTKLGPDDAYGIMDQVYEILIHKVHDYEGTVNEMTGDGIMALFGAPIALEDAPQRAIRSGLAIQREMAKFSDTLRQEIKNVPSLKMRIGIHTGPVVVGTLGNNLRVEFKAVGDTVNVASRMEGLAEPGTICVSSETFKLAHGFFFFEGLGERQVKGRREPIRTYRVLEASTRRTRFDVSAEQGLTSLVGRRRELELLVDAFERTKAGRGQAMSIVSEAGVGKSRLLYEFRKETYNEHVTFLEGKCLSYSRSVLYYPIADVLKCNFDIKEGDDDSVITEKVKIGLKTLAANEVSTLPYLLEVLSVKDSGIDKIPMSPEAKRDRIAGALKDIVLKGSEIRPLILAFEDLHWIDKSSEDTLKSLLNTIAGARVFLIFTYRPEYIPGWGGKSYHSQVNLTRLSNRESLTMAANLLGAENIETDLEDLILSKTEGVPFFIEEFVRSLRDFHIIKRDNGKFHLAKNVQAMSVPSTIQDVIMSRVDLLPEGAKEVLLTGSVIEREFSYELIKKVMHLPERELITHLSVLRDSELLYERGIYPETKYIFKHALTREVVYDSMLTNKKRKLHEKIAHTLEDNYEESIGEHLTSLSEHFVACGNYRKGATYYKLAAAKAERAGAIKDAIEHAKDRVRALETLSNEEELQDEIVDARVSLGLYFFQMGYFLEAKTAVEPILSAVEKESPSSKLAIIYVFLGAYQYMIKEDYTESTRYLEKAIELSEKLNDFVSFGFANYLFGLILAFNCSFEKASSYFERLLSMSMAIQSTWRVSAMKSNLSVYAYDHQGRVTLGYHTSNEAIQIAEESGDILSKAMAYTTHGISCYHMGSFEDAERFLLRGIDFTEKIDLMSHSALAHQWLGHTYFDLGKYREAEHQYREAIRIRESSGLFPSSINLNKVALARASLLGSRRFVNLEHLYRNVNENKLKLYDGCMARFIGEILMHMDNNHMAVAEDWIKRALEADERNGMMWDLGRDFAIYGEFLRLTGKQNRARESVEKAIGILQECGANGWVQKYTEALSRL